MKLYSLSTSKLINIASREKKKHPSGVTEGCFFSCVKLQTILIWLVLQSFPTKWTSSTICIVYKNFLASENKTGSSVRWGYDNDLSIDQKRSGSGSKLTLIFRIQNTGPLLKLCKLSWLGGSSVVSKYIIQLARRLGSESDWRATEPSNHLNIYTLIVVL